MRCTKCGTESTTSRKFCAACGSPLPRRCPKCGAENAPSSAFCEDCGTALAVSAAPAVTSSPQSASTAPEIRLRPEQLDASTIDGERKTVTALFADIKGSTELMRDLDPEEASAIVDPVLRLMMEAVHRTRIVAPHPAPPSLRQTRRSQTDPGTSDRGQAIHRASAARQSPRNCMQLPSSVEHLIQSPRAMRSCPQSLGLL
jgi:Double zinc ribbon